MRTRSVLILGGATENSIGAAIASRLSDLGHQVFAPTLEELDVTEEPRPDKDSMLMVIHEFRPDSVVYCVGVNELDWSWALERDSFDRIMTTNVWGFINLLKALQFTGLPFNVLALTSDAAVRPMRTSIAYCASKAALNQAIRVASRELAPEGWRINGLAPGKVAGTAMTEYVDARVLETRGWSKEYAEEYERKSSSIGRPLTVEEVAAVACDVLLSEAIGWTGDIVTVNGGR